MSLQRAKLIALEEDLKTEKPAPDNHEVTVQFNPETLKLSFANQIDTKDQSSGTAGKQFVGSGTTKLSLQLWFDATAPMPEGEAPVDDVRKLTQRVVYFMTPQGSKADPKKLLPPGVRFQWGTFLFEGVMDSLEESIEFFSSDGLPLRASVSLNLSQQKILQVKFANGEGPGTRPLVQAPAGSNLHALADGSGKGRDVQQIAAANGIENMRLLAPGQLIDMNRRPT